MDLPQLSVNHRFGKVFLHFRRKTKAGYVTTVARLEPKEAGRIAAELVKCVEQVCVLAAERQRKGEQKHPGA